MCSIRFIYISIKFGTEYLVLYVLVFFDLYNILTCRLSIMCKDEGKKGYLKYVFFAHIYVTIAFSITNNKRNPKISKPFL